MNELYIVRHGVAVEHGTPNVPDDERPLTPKGEKHVRQVGRGLAALELPIDRIVSSPLPRAWRTAELIAKALGLEDSLDSDDVLRAGNEARTAFEWLRERPEARLMIVGHNPMLDRLLGLLAVGDEYALPFTFKKGGVAALYRQPMNTERFQIAWLAQPGMLRRIE